MITNYLKLNSISLFPYATDSFVVVYHNKLKLRVVMEHTLMQVMFLCVIMQTVSVTIHPLCNILLLVKMMWSVFL